MSMTLYHGEPNGPSFTVLAALFEKGLDAKRVLIQLAAGERHELDVAKQPEIAMSVEGEGPVLVVDGEAMADSVFIACYLDDVGKGSALRPADSYARWETMTWCRQMIERTAPAAAYLGCRAYPPKADAARLAEISSVDLRARWEDIAAGRFADDKLADSEAKITQAVRKIEAQLDRRKWLLGEFTIADLESYAWLAGMVALVPAAFAGAPRTVAWLERVKSRSAVARALSVASEGDPLKCWAPGPEINRWG
jgi:GSH-dependent disulfide-bond oxidoreductase